MNWPHEDPAVTLERLRQGVDDLYASLPAFREKLETADPTDPDQVKDLLFDDALPMFVRAVVLEKALQYTQARLRNNHEQ